MSARQIPHLIFLDQPIAISDFDYRNHSFRVEFRGRLGNWELQIKTRTMATQIDLFKMLDHTQRERWYDDVALWQFWCEREQDEMFELPHRAIYRVCDCAFAYWEKEREERNAKFQSEHPKQAAVLARLHASTHQTDVQS